jgi:hypothetical protein
MAWQPTEYIPGKPSCCRNIWRVIKKISHLTASEANNLAMMAREAPQ